MFGLKDLFGAGEWLGTYNGPLLGTAAWQLAFQGLIQNGQIDGGGNCQNLLNHIPVNIHNTFEFEPRSQRGFKFNWNDANLNHWQVHGHEADAGAQLGHVGAAGWTVRIQVRIVNQNLFLMSEEWVAPPHVNLPSTHWKQANSNWTIQHSHIPLINV